MSTHAIIAADIFGKVEGRYVHLDGYPHGAGRELARIIKRDGVDRAIKVLLLDHGDWSCITATAEVSTGWGTLVPDYGVSNGDGEWYPVGPTVATKCGAHWAYVMDLDGEHIHTYKAIDDRWYWFDTVTVDKMINHEGPEEE